MRARFLNIFSFHLQLEIKSSELSLLTRITHKKWYPKIAQRRLVAATVEEVIDNMLVAMPKMNSLEAIQDICEEFKNVER